ncbi:hypothetical protein PAMA_019312 [Pampus argenteus]
MGNKFSRRRDVPVNSAEAAVTEQKAAEEPATTQPGENSGMTPIQENLDIVVGETVTQVACEVSSEESVSECKEAEAPAALVPQNDAEPEPEAKETPASVQPEALASVSQPSPPEPEPVAEDQFATEPAPEPVQEPEPTLNPEVDVEVVPEPIPEPVPTPAAVEQETDLLTQESLSEPVIAPSPLVDQGALDVTPQLIDTLPSPALIPAPVNAEDFPVGEEFQDSTEAAVISTLELQKSEETSESLEKLMEAEAAGNLEQLVSDVNKESISSLQKQIELTGNDLVTDPSDVKIPDDTPVVDISTSTELM